MSLFLNQTCLNERRLPNYTYFKIHDPAVHHNTGTQKYCCSLVQRQMNYNKEKTNTLNTEAHNVHNKLKNSLSTQLLQDNFGKFIHQFQPETKTLIRKLERILIKLYNASFVTGHKIFTHHHHYHHVVRLAQISLTLSLSTSPYHSSPPACLQGYIPYHHIACCMYVRAGRPALRVYFTHVWRRGSLALGLSQNKY